MTQPDNRGARGRLLDLMLSGLIANAIRCIVKIGIPDSLTNGPKTAAQLAELTHTSSPHLERLMVALSGIGVFRKSGQDFELTNVSEQLTTDNASGLAAVVSLFGEEMAQAYDRLPRVIQSGAPVWEELFGQPIWQYFTTNPIRGRVFDESMRALSSSDVEIIVSRFDFSCAKTIVDLGGGDGTLLRAILAKNVATTGFLFDLPVVVEAALEKGPEDERLVGWPGDLFESLPKKHDVYILRRVLHDWSDRNAGRILRSCHEAMSPSSTLLIIEAVISEDFVDPRTAWSDVGLMAVCEGKERRLDEFAKLCDCAGLRIVDVLPLGPSTNATIIQAKQVDGA